MFSSGRQEEDHLYDFNTNIDIVSKGPMTAFGRGPAAAGRPLMSSMGKAVPVSRGAGAPGSRMGTSQQGGGGSEARPMTSISGAGYQGSAKEQRSFDPLNIGKGPAPPLAEKADNSFEDKAKEMEKGVHRLVEASAEAVAIKNFQLALDKAKEAGKSERQLCKFRESHGLAEQINLDLTYAICFNLANAYYHNKMYEEALNTYQVIVKNKQYPQSGRLRVNMGNIYYEQKKYPQAIKMYRMALDQIPSTGKELRFRIFRNIGNAFVRLGQFQDAIDSYESVMTGSADVHTAFNLLLCLYARGDWEKTRKHFMKMISIPIPGMTDEEAEKVNEAATVTMDLAPERPDSLREELTRRHELSSDKILTSARLIAPHVDDKQDWIAGYKWVMEQLRTDFESLASKVELDLSMEYMKRRRFEDAIEVLKAFERKDPSLRAMASANLSFIYFLEGDYTQAEKHADLAIRSDRYNAKALVNKGNCLYAAGDFARAKDMYLEAVGVEANCVEAIFNLGLTNLRLEAVQQAHHAFDKLHTILPTVPEALFHLGAIYDRSSDNAELEQAAKTFEMLLHKVPGDPYLCQKIGHVYEKMDDDNTACHWNTESHRYCPVNLNVISWLGVWYVKREMYEQAIEYFERAALVQPGEIKWQLMVSSCYRRLGDFHKALDQYMKIHEEHPDNLEALQYLEALCRDLGRPHEEYSRKLEKLRRAAPQQTVQNGTATRVGGATNGSAPAPQRSERPMPERPAPQAERPLPSRSSPSSAEEVISSSAGRSPMAAPRAGGQQNRSGPPARGRPADEEDEFADTDVTSLLG